MSRLSLNMLTIPLLLSLFTSTYAIPAAETVDFSPNLIRLYSDYNSRTHNTLLPRLQHSPHTPHTQPHWVLPPQNVFLPTTGNIRMKSDHNHEIPLSFSLSPHTCLPLATECTCLAKDLQERILEKHKDGVRFSRKCGMPTLVSETVKLHMGGREFRASLAIKLKGEVGGRMGRREWEALVGLLGRAVQEIERESERRGATGLGSVLVAGSIEGLGVESLWSFYEVLEGEVARCS